MLVDEYLSKIKDQTFFAGKDKEGSIRWHIKWYRDKATRKRYWFRITGLITIVTSISLPFVTGLVSEKYKVPVASSIAWIIALSGGINGFFQFNKSWQNYIEARFNLESLLTEWELNIYGLMGKSDIESTVKAQELTLAFVNKARAVIMNETKTYFEEIKFPNINIETNNERPER